MMLTQGIQHILEIVIGGQEVPDDYWIGLAKNTLFTLADTMADVDELVGDGYERQRFAPGETAAEGLLTVDTEVIDGNTMTLGGITYRFKDVTAQAEDIQIGGDLAGTQDNLIATLNGTGAAGVEYHVGTTSPHPSVKIGEFNEDDVAVVRARTRGAAGNDIATTSNFDSGGNGFDAATLGDHQAGGVVQMTSQAGGVAGRALISTSVTFTADGGNWDATYTAFMTTTKEGTDGPLIATEPLNDGDGIALTDGQSYDVGMSVLGQPTS